MRYALLALAAATCNPSQPSAPTDPPTTVTVIPDPSAPPTVAPAPSAPVQDPSACATACDRAQKACPKPASVAHCLAQCQAATKYLTAPSAECAALVATCNTGCTP